VNTVHEYEVRAGSRLMFDKLMYLHVYLINTQ